ncbi:sulfite exporter TauE/SafE family protein [Campylobacter sp. MG1]|uniref:sulfite exporter TauE/SafE family protein n=1 Tax=Campylobacter sp. MG1 TaxID=2976332 RepID=UPI00226C8098|nr:sulfite exporter TauE/SafE family protein [Campylobacter sp. MG1]
MLSSLLGTFLLGLGLSLTHCFFMCGGILILFNQSKTNIIDITLYHFFRILAYCIIGVLAYFLGFYISSLSFQIFLYAFLGIFCILLGFALLQRGLLLSFFENQFIYKQILKLLKKNKKTRYKGIIFGFLNGFFPCGLVYFFIAKSMVSKNIIEAFLTMLLFGISTLPAMFLGSVLINKLKSVKYISNFLFFVIIIYGFYLCYLALNLSR